MNRALKLQLARIFEGKFLITLILVMTLVGIGFLFMNDDMTWMMLVPAISCLRGVDVFTMDEKCHMSYYTAAMPIRRRDQVATAYIVSLVSAAVMMALIIFCVWLICASGWTIDPELAGGGIKNDTDLLVMYAILEPGIAMLFGSAALFSCFYSMKKLTMIILVTIAYIIGMVPAQMSSGGITKYIIMLVLGAAAYALSWHASKVVYERRDL